MLCAARWRPQSRRRIVGVDCAGIDAGLNPGRSDGELIAAARAADDPVPAGPGRAVPVEALRTAIGARAAVGVAPALGAVAVVEAVAQEGVQLRLELASVELLLAR